MRVARPAVVAGALILAGACLVAFAPGYWTELGFPLDDSWIHAVYGRELARSGMLAYNPGIPAAGATSPLWAGVFALPHVVTSDPRAVTLIMKIIGFTLHALTAFLALQLAERVTGKGHVAALTAAALVALHPDLLAASVTGMELPLATTLGLWVMLEVLRGPSWRLAIACALAPLGRPEIAVIGVLAGAFAFVSGIASWRRVFQLALIVGLASAASMGGVMLRTWLATGRPLPSTFYAKVGGRGLSPWFVQWFSYRHLLDHFPLVNLFVLAPVTLFAIWILLRPRLRGTTTTSGTSDTSETGASMPLRDAEASVILLTGVAFFSISFALVAPVGDTSFYFQRYSLPGVPFFLIGLPLLIDMVLRAIPTQRLTVLRAAIVVALAVGLLAPMPARLWHLGNDARNIDDVQVAEGKALAQAAPQQVAWVVDAGATRYFGNAFVVDMVGLNTPEILTREAPGYLAAHRPHYISIVGGGWSELDEASMRRMSVAVFSPTTPYTVTAYPPQAVHYLMKCPQEPLRGRYATWGRGTTYECGAW